MRVGIAHRQDGVLELSVADDGIGLAPDELARVMMPFEQIEAASNRKRDGTGLGLPLTSKLVELHGGTLHLRSELGIGTTVTIRFPKARVLDEVAEPQIDDLANEQRALHLVG